MAFKEEGTKCTRCSKGKFYWERGCGALVCDECDYHKGLARCFCGWAASGGNGYQELQEMGETIEPDGPDWT